MKPLTVLLLLFIYFIPISCTRSVHDPPKLIVLFVVDMMRPDRFTRFENIFEGGLRWLIDNGTLFTNAHHNHSYTVTGPGHVAIAYGQHPGKLGLIGNSYYDRVQKRSIYCVEDEKARVIGSDKGKARSMTNYKAKGLGDCIKDNMKSSKVISIGGKDRAGCILGGKNPDIAVYYNKNGEFITSDYYVDIVPKWLENFNQNSNLNSYKDSLWKRSLSSDLYLDHSREDNYRGEVDDFETDKYSPTFPIGIDKDKEASEVLISRPWFEREILNLSMEALKAEKLGIDAQTDLLAIGFSAMDYMGHKYGPFSQEMMDAFIKLDKYLDNFINDIDNIVGLENTLFILTADHGVCPLPEYLLEKGEQGGRINKKNLQEALDWIDDEVEELLGKDLYHRVWTKFYINHEKLELENIDKRDIYDIVEKYLTKVVGIEKIIINEDIMNATVQNEMTIKFRNMIHPERSPDIYAILSPGYMHMTPHGTTHGSPYKYDTHVPILFSRYGFKSKSDDTFKTTVDIAPTILEYLGIEIPRYFDGNTMDL